MPACQDSRTAASAESPAFSAVSFTGSITRNTSAKRLTVLMP